VRTHCDLQRARSDPFVGLLNLWSPLPRHRAQASPRRCRWQAGRGRIAGLPDNCW
jgi:hypothetical protein